MNNTGRFRRFFAVVCILLILVYASVSLLPHSHENGVENCAVCALIKSTDCTASVVGLCLILSFFNSICSRTFDAFREAMILHDNAPVWLKVKLSD